MDAAWLTEINAAGQFADNHDVEAADHIRLQRRKIREGIETLRRPKVRIKIHLFAQAQQAALRLYAEIEIVIFRAADRAKQHGINALRFFHRLIGQRRAMRIICATAHQIFGDIKGQATLCAIPVDDFAHLGHNLGADPVTGKNEKRWVAHGTNPS